MIIKLTLFCALAAAVVFTPLFYLYRSHKRTTRARWQRRSALRTVVRSIVLRDGDNLRSKLHSACRYIDDLHEELDRLIAKWPLFTGNKYLPIPDADDPGKFYQNQQKLLEYLRDVTDVYK